MLRMSLCTVVLFSLFLFSGCSGGVPAEAQGDPVPPDYEWNQYEATQKAKESAMKSMRKSRR